MMAHPYDSKAKSTPHPLHSQVKTSQARADARYGKFTAPSLRTGPLIAAAERTGMPEETFVDAPARQVSDLGKVRK